jgi:hypothetical protein
MKLLIYFLFASLFLLLVNEGCSRWFEVSPKEIYSPIDLNDQVDLKTTSVRDIYGCVLSFTGKDTTLKYGVLLFYDSLASITFIKKQLRTTPTESIRTRKSGDKTYTSDTIHFDLTKGEFMYLVPFGYDRKDSISRVLTAQGCIKVRISPWVYLTNIPGTYIRNKARIYENNGQINCLKIDNESVTNYEYKNQQWATTGKFKNESCQGFKFNAITYPFKATEIYSVFMVNGRYHVLVNLKADVPDEKSLKYSLSLLTLDKDFALIDCQSIVQMSNRNAEVLTSFTDDKNLYLITRTEVIECFQIPFAKPSVNKITIKNTVDASKLYVWTNNSAISSIKPTINSGSIYYQTDQQTIHFKLNSSIHPDVFLNKGQGFLALNNVKVVNDVVTTTMSEIYTAWFPRGNSRYISHGFSGKDGIVLVISDYEVWLFNIYSWSENAIYKLSYDIIKL